MAGGGFADNAGRGRQYEGGVTFFVMFTCVVGATGGLIFGYDIGISGFHALSLNLSSNHS